MSSLFSRGHQTPCMTWRAYGKCLDGKVGLEFGTQQINLPFWGEMCICKHQDIQNFGGGSRRWDQQQIFQLIISGWLVVSFIFLECSPRKLVKMNPFLTIHIFHRGWFQHQPVVVTFLGFMIHRFRSSRAWLTHFVVVAIVFAWQQLVDDSEKNVNIYIYAHIQESLGIIVGEVSMTYMIYGDSLKAMFFKSCLQKWLALLSRTRCCKPSCWWQPEIRRFENQLIW